MMAETLMRSLIDSHALEDALPDRLSCSNYLEKTLVRANSLVWPGLNKLNSFCLLRIEWNIIYYLKIFQLCLIIPNLMR